MNCRICSSENLTSFTVKEMVLGYRDTFNYLFCKTCGCIQIENIPANLAHYYPLDYYSLHTDFNTKPVGKVMSMAIKCRDLYFFNINNNLIGKQLQKLFPSYIEAAYLAYQFVYRQYNQNADISIHDAGCGTGDFLNYFHRLRFKNLSGSDPFIEKDIINNELIIYKKNLKDVDGKFDIIILNHVFEHVINPKEYLQVVHSKLKSGGKCLVRMPMANSLGFERYNSNWVGLEAPRHLHVFSKKGFESLASDCGFSVNDVKYDAVGWHYMVSESYKKGISINELQEDTISDIQKLEYDSLAKNANELKRGDTCAYYLEKQ